MRGKLTTSFTDSGHALQIERERVLARIRGSEPLVVLSAPSGYGKSTVARQLLTDSTDSVWADCSGAESTAALWNSVGLALQGEMRSHSSRSGLLPMRQDDVVAADIAARLSARTQSPTVIVLDGLDEESVLHSSISWLRTLSETLPSGSQVVVTTRSPAPQQWDQRVRVVGAEALAMNVEEALELAAAAAPRLSEDEVLQSHSASCGQVALLVTLLNWATGPQGPLVHSGGGHSDLGFLLRSMAESQLSSVQSRVLRAAAIMRRGWIADLRKAADGASSHDVCRVASCVPLFALEHSDGVPTKFRLHDLAVAVFDADEWHDADAEGTAKRSLKVLEDSGRFDAVMRGVLKVGEPGAIAQTLEQYGHVLLAQGHTGLLDAAASALEPSLYLRRPKLLLLRARMSMAAGRPADAISEVAVALELGEHDGDAATVVDALATLARAQLDSGMLEDASGSVRRLLSVAGDRLDDGTRAVALSYLAMCTVGLGEAEEAAEHCEQAMQIAQDQRIGADERTQVVCVAMGLRAIVGGRWEFVVENTVDLLVSGNLSLGMELQVRNNNAAALLQLGRIDTALAEIEDVRCRAERYGIAFILPCVYSTEATILAAVGDYNGACAAFTRLQECDAEAPLDRAESLAESAAWQRFAVGPEASLESTESVLSGLSGMRSTEWHAVLEMAASLLALGDARAAQKRASSVRDESVEAGAAQHTLRADLTLAEVDRREGRVSEAIARILESRDYILTENANWLVALYTRSFPALLGVVASAVDPDDLPAHLLRMILPQDREEALVASREVMDPEDWERLAARLMSAEDVERLGEGAGPEPCEVRLLGGMSVKVGERTVMERDWRKRKARILFAMLALRQGRDVPRDQILEHLWPDMDEERARNNLYVIWSAIKSALSPEADKGTPCPYVESARGVCKSVPDLIHTDVDDLEELIARAVAQEEAGDASSALEAYDRLCELYRGDLLPGDMYDDWFAASRDHYRQEFSDAMHRAAGLSLAEGDASRANRFARRALEHDAWREDLYQMALKSQIAAGQRSAAVDTYFACKGKLSEDLGLDPSAETTRLYEQVLAMEADASDRATYSAGETGQAGSG